MFRKRNDNSQIVPTAKRRDKPNGTALVAPRSSPLENFDGEGAVLIGRGTRMTGEIKNASVIEIQGDFDGNVAANTVIVREGATFKGSIHAEYVEANGLVEGTLIAEELLDIRSTGHVMAEVRYGHLCVATGGQLSGNIQSQVIDARAELPTEEPLPPGVHAMKVVNGSASVGRD